MSHPEPNDLSHKKCPAFDSGCPFSNPDLHPSILTSEKLQGLKEKCPAFKDAACPFSNASDKHPTVGSLNEASRCPAFKDGCPFSDVCLFHNFTSLAF
jgi:hypothetical protein